LVTFAPFGGKACFNARTLARLRARGNIRARTSAGPQKTAVFTHALFAQEGAAHQCVRSLIGKQTCSAAYSRSLIGALSQKMPKINSLFA